MILPSIEILPETKLIGKRMSMSYAADLTAALWKSFMPGRKEIVNNAGSSLYSMQLYPSQFFNNFNPHTVFEKWAAIAVTDFNFIPEGMEAFTLPEGLYAVFNYRGSAENAGLIFEYIFNTWLPHSGYSLDDRPHFELLGEKYKRDHPDSEEQIWIPVK